MDSKIDDTLIGGCSLVALKHMPKAAPHTQKVWKCIGEQE